MTAQPDTELPLSRTQRKHEMEALQDLGEALVALPADRVARIDIPDELREAVRAAQRMTRHDEAKRRQMQYIGKLMRKTDTDPIRQALEESRSTSAAETARLHRLERLRDTLLDDEKVLQEILTLYPSIDLQHLRSLRRSAIKEKLENRPPRSYRAIFQALKEYEYQNESADTGAPAHD